MRRRVVQGATLALVGWLVVACSGGGSPNLQSPIEASSSSAATSSPPISRAPVASSSTLTEPLFSSSPEAPSTISVTESADRVAAEAQWTKYWEIYAALPHTPEDQWDSLLAPVAVESMINAAKDDARSIRDEGNDTYGMVGHRFTWTKPIGGSDTAVLQDCNDSSQAGAYETATGNKITVGVPRQNTMGTLVRGADGVWRVSAAYIVKDTPC